MGPVFLRAPTVVRAQNSITAGAIAQGLGKWRARIGRAVCGKSLIKLLFSLTQPRHTGC